MKVNPYYNKDTMNLKQLALDLKNQGFKKKLYFEPSKRSFILNPQKGVRIYSASTNWGVIKLLRKLLKEAK